MSSTSVMHYVHAGKKFAGIVLHFSIPSSNIMGKMLAVKKRIAVLLVCFFCIAAFAHQADVDAAQEVFKLLNAERVKAGQPPLVWNFDLAHAALDHSKRMAEQTELSHRFAGEPALMDRLAKTNVRLKRAGENVGFNASVAGVHRDFMNSSAHRANIMSPNYNAVGIAAVRKDNLLWVTQDFAHVLPETPASEFEKILLESYAKLRVSRGQAPLKVIDRPELRDMACLMGREDRVDTTLARTIAGGRYFVAATMNDPTQLPSDLVGLRPVPDAASIAAAACYQRTPQYPTGVYWVLVVLFRQS